MSLGRCGTPPDRDGLKRAARFVAAQLAAVFAYAIIISQHAGELLQAPQSGLCLGYIGPGAGVALVGSFLVVFVAVLSAVLALLTWPVRALWRTVRGRRAYARAQARRVVVIGLDGLEPTLVERGMAAGRLPNLAALRDAGTYARLGTTCPPLSPVAWSSFATGCNPGKHNIFDFLTRHPPDYSPRMTSVEMRPPRRGFRIGRRIVSLGRPRITLLRRSKPFWSVLGDAGVFSSVLRVPITFPPERFRGVQLSAMCVPDLRGTQGTFTHFVEGAPETLEGDDETRGERVSVHREAGRVRALLPGPRNSLRVDQPELGVPIEVRRHGKGRLRLHVNGHSVPLAAGRYTPWVPVSFRLGMARRLGGIARFYLKRFEPPFEMYCTPIHLDPRSPAMPISYPRAYAPYLGNLLGPFATLGLAEDTGGLSSGVLDEEAFLQQTYDIHAERERMLFDVLRRQRCGLVACVFDAPDRIQHMFWRFMDERHPARGGSGADGDADARATPDANPHGDTILDMYTRMDALVGRIRARLSRQDVLLVLSDHGFHPFRRCVDLNAWLRENAFLRLKDGARTSNAPFLADVDWSRTQAYALGLAGIFINLKGREGQGIVEPGDEARQLVSELRLRLTGLRDDAGQAVAVHEALPRATAYRGPYVENAPDLIVGYASGYRVAWQAAMGKCGETVFTDNTRAWSGDHCIHPKLAPGVLFSDRKLRTERAQIIDLGPTVLDLFGVQVPDYMDGTSLLPDPSKLNAPG
jgi:predicted AlkP superfamily phosphohydrolase/phosphomutase